MCVHRRRGQSVFGLGMNASRGVKCKVRARCMRQAAGCAAEDNSRTKREAGLFFYKKNKSGGAYTCTPYVIALPLFSAGCRRSTGLRRRRCMLPLGVASFQSPASREIKRKNNICVLHVRLLVHRRRGQSVCGLGTNASRGVKCKVRARCMQQAAGCAAKDNTRTRRI